MQTYRRADLSTLMNTLNDLIISAQGFLSDLDYDLIIEEGIISEISGTLKDELGEIESAIEAIKKKHYKESSVVEVTG